MKRLIVMSVAAVLATAAAETTPWSRSEVIAPAELAHVLASSDPHPVIISVTFPMLYKGRHIRGALFAGPGNKSVGLQALQEVVSKLDKGTPIVLYCGCCPMDKCPNIRPAFAKLRELGFTHLSVLDIPANLHADWTSHGYPVEPTDRPESGQGPGAANAARPHAAQ